ncbi:MAG: cytochrome c [Bacteroidia bacterium]|nr:cytochrome c [Bacteroidia bacterium]
MKRIVSFSFAAACLFALVVVSCKGGEDTNTSGTNGASQETPSANNSATSANTASYDPKRGEGKFDASNVKVAALDESMVTKGDAIFKTKCSACHKLTDEKLVGPGWKGVTGRKEPYWIMNFITNPDAMIDKDPELQAQLEICLVRMPNQNLTDDDARHILEFMRKNDGAK